ncbi:MAG TPA: substrate-binding domain-containing protein [Rubrivivax sp.]|nr:substrate-binding domain-containing protein [Rubrivivax sp.]
MPTSRLNVISSMATRALLADLAAAWARRGGIELAVESVGGVDAARRVEAAEAFDLVVLAADAIDKLQASGRVVAGSRTDLVHSGVAVAVRAGAPHPDIGSEAALREAVLAARTIGHSTGPSGTALLQLFARWGLADTLRARIVQAPPGVPVGALVARGDVELGFQQLSELMHLPGIELLGPMPAEVQIVTTFAAGLCAASTQVPQATAVLDFLRSPQTAELKRRHGMQPA